MNSRTRDVQSRGGGGGVHALPCRGKLTGGEQLGHSLCVSVWLRSARWRYTYTLDHPGGNPGANLKSASHR